MTDNQPANNFLIDFINLFLDRRVSLVSKLLFAGGLGVYWLLPVDIVPDFLLPFGIIDDGGVFLTAVMLFTRTARQQLESGNTLSEEIDNEGKQIYISQKSGRGGVNEVALGCLAFTGVISLIIFTGVAISILSGVWTINTVLASISGFFGQPTTATVVPSRTIVTSLKPLGQLVSISVEVAQADIHVGVNTGGINLCGHSANHVAQGAVEAGVDITNVGEDSIMSLFVTDTIEAGIISRAERETTLLMQSFVSALTGSEVKVVYTQTGEETPLPASCQPQLPRGWVFDETQNTWVKTE
jgi:uncharacterized membrane protein YkvA (DUF1232 family)